MNNIYIVEVSNCDVDIDDIHIEFETDDDLLEKQERGHDHFLLSDSIEEEKVENVKEQDSICLLQKQDESIVSIVPICDGDSCYLADNRDEKNLSLCLEDDVRVSYHLPSLIIYGLKGIQVESDDKDRLWIDLKAMNGYGQNLIELRDESKEEYEMELSKMIFMDCEWVYSVGCEGPCQDVVSVALVDISGNVVYQSSNIAPRGVVYNYVTEITGYSIRSQYNEVFFEVKNKVQEIIRDKIVVGHSVINDLHAMGLYVEGMKYRDISILFTPRTVSLQHLFLYAFGVAIQVGRSHSPIEDALASMMIYKKYSKWYYRLYHGFPSFLSSDDVDNLIEKSKNKSVLRVDLLCYHEELWSNVGFPSSGVIFVREMRGYSRRLKKENYKDQRSNLVDIKIVNNKKERRKDKLLLPREVRSKGSIFRKKQFTSDKMSYTFHCVRSCFVQVEQICKRWGLVVAVNGLNAKNRNRYCMVKLQGKGSFIWEVIQLIIHKGYDIKN